MVDAMRNKEVRERVGERTVRRRYKLKGSIPSKGSNNNIITIGTTIRRKELYQ